MGRERGFEVVSDVVEKCRVGGCGTGGGGVGQKQQESTVQERPLSSNV